MFAFIISDSIKQIKEPEPNPYNNKAEQKIENPAERTIHENKQYQ